MASIEPTGKLILVVDDEPVVVRAVTTALAMAGFRVIVAENGAAGLDAFIRAQSEIDLVLADIVMPFIGGLEMARRIKAIRADVPILLMSGYSEAVIEQSPDFTLPLIRKPFLLDDLVRAVQANLSPPAASA